MLKEAAFGWIEDNAPRLAAAIAFTTMFSLAPLLILVVSVAGIFWGSQSGGAQAALVQDMQGMIGAEGATVIQGALENAERPGSGGTLATILGVVTLIIGATALFAQLQDALNTIWGVKPNPREGAVKTLIKARLLSFGMILTVGFLLLVSLVVSVAIAAVANILPSIGPLTEWLVQAVNIVVSVGLSTALFALIYRYLPDARVEWRDVWVGGLITALLFTIGKLLIGLYLGNSSAASAYGAAGSLVVLLSWVYFSAMILLFGAEVTQVYATKYGHGVVPTSHAVRVVTQTLEVDHKLVQHASKAEEKEKALEAHLPTRAAPPEPKKPSFAARALPFAAVFVAGRLTKRARAKKSPYRTP